MPVHTSLPIVVGYFMYVFETSTLRAPEDRKHIHIPLFHVEQENFLVLSLHVLHWDLARKFC